MQILFHWQQAQQEAQLLQQQVDLEFINGLDQVVLPSKEKTTWHTLHN
jgi:hypothetical protein